MGKENQRDKISWRLDDYEIKNNHGKIYRYRDRKLILLGLGFHYSLNLWDEDEPTAGYFFEKKDGIAFYISCDGLNSISQEDFNRYTGMIKAEKA